MIPDEVVEAAYRLLWHDGGGNDVLPSRVRAAIAAALSVWPGALHSPDEVIDGELLPPIISLPFPLPQEPRDD